MKVAVDGYDGIFHHFHSRHTIHQDVHVSIDIDVELPILSGDVQIPSRTNGDVPVEPSLSIFVDVFLLEPVNCTAVGSFDVSETSFQNNLVEVIDYLLYL